MIKLGFTATKRWGLVDYGGWEWGDGVVRRSEEGVQGRDWGTG